MAPHLLSSLTLAVVASATLLVDACAPVDDPTSVPTAPTEPPKVATADMVVISNSSPHVTIIDAETNLISRKTDIPDFTSWTWNDDNNHFDGTNLWLGMKDSDRNEIEVIALDLDTLQLTARLALGPEALTLYIGQAKHRPGERGRDPARWEDGRRSGHPDRHQELHGW